MKKNIHIIGSGFSALSASCYLAKQGYNVTVLEKNDTLGGRARQFKKDGFTFDLGPSWYWMPDVFERFFADFGKKPSDYYTLDKLSPGYEVYFGESSSLKISDNLENIYKMFEEEEKGSAKHLKTFLDSAKSNYDTAIKNLVYKPGVSPLELVTTTTVARVTQFFSTIRKQVRKNITSPKLIKILEFPVLFLGAKPSNTPAFYNFMNYADFGLGTWHPRGGMYKVVEGMVSLAESLGVNFLLNANVEKINTDAADNVIGLQVNGENIETSLVLSGADYHHTETLLAQNLRQYSENYWDKKTFAPSSLLFYVGFDKKIENVCHHTLFNR
jgi:phytoene desaturase